jgi:acyl-CoA synthetase (AMP-forming)/AMP-acid ligase II
VARRLSRREGRAGDGGLGALLAGPDGVLVHDRDGSHERAEVAARASAVAERLRVAGVGPGDAVAVSLPDTVEVVAALFGVWEVGAAYVPLNPRLTAGEAAGILDAVGAAAVLTADGVQVRAGGRRFEPDVALVQHTSGTTGRPRPVLLLHEGVLTLLDNVVATLRGERPRRGSRSQPPATNLIPVSLSLWAGLYQVLFALRVGAPMVLMDGFDTRRFAELVAAHGVRSVVLPPAAMAMLVDDEGVETLEPLRFVRSITAPLSPLQARRFKERFGITVLNSYGQTEIGGEIVGWSAADAREHGEAKLGSVGRPHAGVELRADPDTGEIQVRTPALSGGYADGSDLSDRLTADGWFRTGDVGHVDEDGFLWIDGRVVDMINRGGLKVFPGEVEEVVRLAAGVSDVAVVGVPDERLGEVPWAFVVGPGGHDDASLEATCRLHLAPYKVPVRFEPISRLPRNPVGKVLTGDLRELAVKRR